MKISETQTFSLDASIRLGVIGRSMQYGQTRFRYDSVSHKALAVDTPRIPVDTVDSALPLMGLNSNTVDLRKFAFTNLIFSLVKSPTS